MHNTISFDEEIDTIEQHLKKGERLDKGKMTILFFLSFLREEGKIESESSGEGSR